VSSQPKEIFRFPCRLSNVSCRCTRKLRRRSRRGMLYCVDLRSRITTTGNNPLFSPCIRDTSRPRSITSSCQTRTASHPKNCSYSSPYRGCKLCPPVPIARTDRRNIRGHSCPMLNKQRTLASMSRFSVCSPATRIQWSAYHFQSL
jgi:hypothetical protein